MNFEQDAQFAKDAAKTAFVPWDTVANDARAREAEKKAKAATLALEKLKARLKEAERKADELKAVVHITPKLFGYLVDNLSNNEMYLLAQFLTYWSVAEIVVLGTDGKAQYPPQEDLSTAFHEFLIGKAQDYLRSVYPELWNRGLNVGLKAFVEKVS